MSFMDYEIQGDNCMKIGRNEPCPCGSGKKYKKCCLTKSDEQRLAEAVLRSSQNLKNEAHIKQCLHPNKDECDEKIIKAHAIQNNRILNKISEKGMIVSMDGVQHLVLQTAETKGRKVATVFTGFCRYHDKTLFQEIEDKPFTCTSKQLFILTYRTMAWHYHKKQEQINATCIQYEKLRKEGFDLAKSDDYIDYLTMLSAGNSDNEIEKRQFDKYLLEENFDVISSVIWEIPYEVSFAVSMMTELEHDIKGNILNDMLGDEPTSKIYLNIFPADRKSFCIWSWLKDKNNCYKEFAHQFEQLSIVDRENYFNNYLPRWTDSIVISPRLWDYWKQPIQEAFITHANFDILYRQMEKETDEYAYQYSDTPWNLFENLVYN